MTVPTPSEPRSGELQFDLTEDDEQLFLAEVDELLQRTEEALVDLERSPDDAELLQEIFRAAHTIKGSSATIGHTRMASLTHVMETRLDEVRKGVAPVTPGLIEALLTSLDVLKVLRNEVLTRSASAVDVDAVIAALERGTAGEAAPAKPRAAAPKAAKKTKKGAAADAETHRITVTLEPGPWMAVRALQTLIVLGEHGKVLSSEPTQAEIEREDAQIGDHVVVLIHTDETEQALHDALGGVPELGSVIVEATRAPGVPETPAVPIEVAPSPEAAAEPIEEGRSLAEIARGQVSDGRVVGGASKTIRIDVTRLDALLNLVGELVIDRTRLVQIGNAMADRFDDDRLLGELLLTSVHIGRITDELQEQVMKSRMLPIETVFSRLPRVVRDVASKQGKQIDFVVDGKDTELDRSVIEEIGDPLIHLIRNAVDHGIELPDERKAAGKSATGRVRLSARHADSYILITLEDDGRGIDVEAVKRKAVERGVIGAEQAERMSEQEAVQLIFAPGLSTAKQISDVSGRGVGMDVVRANVEKLNGGVEVQSRPGRGTTFIIRLPLTLAIVQALLVRVAGVIYALPIHTVTETLQVEDDQIHRVNHHEAMVLRGTVLPLVSLRHIFGVEESETPDIGADERLVVAVHTGDGRQVGVIVDGLVGEQEIVIKPLGQFVGDVAGVSGAAILGDGSVALILDVAALVAQAVRDGTTVAAQRPPQRNEEEGDERGNSPAAA